MGNPAGIVHLVEPGSPADKAGLRVGDALLAADGAPLHDIVDWRWYADDRSVTVLYQGTDGIEHEVELRREPGQDWGIEFEDILFDGTHQCCNACTFCFMRQLPPQARSSLKVRDDDFRLSFLQGNFVTFTNLDSEDEQRIIEQCISPLRFSLHAVEADLRREMIGPYAQRGIEAAERLLAAGIELHVQIVLVPGVNDGEHLERTLEWAYGYPGILNVGIVPLGYTKHQNLFDMSFQDIAAARQVLLSVEPFQRRAVSERGFGWVYPSDEFYRNAFPNDLLDHLPAASFYGDFALFEDGIGIVRSFVDDWHAAEDAQESLAHAIRGLGYPIVLVCGVAQQAFLDPLLAASPLYGLLIPLYVENDYFGGNVDVTGLLCGCDVLNALAEIKQGSVGYAFIPEVVLNADGVMLDDITSTQLVEQAGLPVHVVSCEASKYLPQMQAIIEKGGAPCQSIS